MFLLTPLLLLEKGFIIRDNFNTYGSKVVLFYFFVFHVLFLLLSKNKNNEMLFSLMCK